MDYEKVLGICPHAPFVYTVIKNAHTHTHGKYSQVGYTAK